MFLSFLMFLSFHANKLIKFKSGNSLHWLLACVACGNLHKNFISGKPNKQGMRLRMQGSFASSEAAMEGSIQT